MRQTIFLTILVATIAALVGCASKQPVQPKADPAIEQLNQAAASIQRDLEQLSRIKQSGYEKVDLYNSPQKGALTKKITLKWSGPINSVLEIIALSIGYEFKVRGEAPASPVLITVDEIQTPAFEVLENLGWKAGKHQVTVDAGKQMVQLTYFEQPYPKSASLRSGK